MCLCEVFTILLITESAMFDATFHLNLCIHNRYRECVTESRKYKMRAVIKSCLFFHHAIKITVECYQCETEFS